MNLQPLKYHCCSLDQGRGVLLVDIESESVLRQDGHGNRLYYCLAGQHLFSVDANNQVVEEKVPPLAQNHPHA